MVNHGTSYSALCSLLSKELIQHQQYKNWVSQTTLVNYGRWLEVEYQGFNMLTYPSHPHEMVQQDTSQSVSDTYDSVFVRSDAIATIFCTAHFGAATIWRQLLFKGGVHFFGKSAGINDGWIMYIRAIQWWLLELSVVSTASQSCCLPWNKSYHTNSPSTSLVIFIRNYSHMVLVQQIVAAANTRGQCLFAQSSSLCAYYSKVVSIWRNTVHLILIY